MTTDEKLDLIISELGGINKRLDTIESDMQEVKADIVEMKAEILHINKRLFVIEHDMFTLNFKVDEIRTWTRMDLKDNPFLRNRAVA